MYTLIFRFGATQATNRLAAFEAKRKQLGLWRQYRDDISSYYPELKARPKTKQEKTHVTRRRYGGDHSHRL